MARETFRDVHVDRPLTNMSVAHFQDTSEFVSHRFFPRVPVTNSSDDYWYYPGGYFNKIHPSRRAEEGIANTIGYKAILKHYSIEDNALRVYISDKKRANADAPRRLDQEAAILLTNSLLLSSEKDFSDSFLVPGVWTTEREGVPATPTGDQVLQWSDAASDPVRDVQNARREMLLAGKRRPNKALMSLDVFDALKLHPDIMERIKYTGTMNDPARGTMNAIATLFELDEIQIMQTVLNTAPDGVEDPVTGEPATTDVFLNEGVFLMAYVPNGIGVMAPVAGVMFTQNSWLPPGADGGPSLRRYRETDAKRGEYIEAEYAKQHQIVSPDLGAFMYNLV